MKTSDFHFDLPAELIAQRPSPERRNSRLLVLRADGGIEDRQFSNLPELIRRGDLLVLNDTRVIPARLLGTKQSGGRVEVLVERVESHHEALVHIRASKACKPGNHLLLEQRVELEVLGRAGECYRVRLHGEEDFYSMLERAGRIPLPPYINRTADEQD